MAYKKIWFNCTKCGVLSWIEGLFSEAKPMIAEDLICDGCLPEEES